MKGLRFLLLGLAICFTSGVKAQFYDSADDIYYYLMYEFETDIPYLDPWSGQRKLRHKVIKYDDSKEGDEVLRVLIFNFDGNKAARLADFSKMSSVKDYLQKSSTYFEDIVETTEYTLKYTSSSSGIVYKDAYYTYTFSNDRNTLVSIDNNHNYIKRYYKRVDKSFFKIGRSRTPSGTMHE